MALINYTPISNGIGSDVNQINDPIEQIVNEINGNIDTVNLKNSAVTTLKLNDAAVTTPKVADDAITPAKWTNPYCFAAINSTTSLPNATTTKLDNFSSKFFDPNNNFDAVAGEYTAPVDGYYFLYANAGITDHADNGRVILSIRVDTGGGFGTLQEGWALAGSTIHDPLASISAAYACSAGAVFDVVMYHDDGSTQTPRSSSFGGFLIHAT